MYVVTDEKGMQWELLPMFQWTPRDGEKVLQQRRRPFTHIGPVGVGEWFDVPTEAPTVWHVVEN